ncbi:MAG: hypothetical protein ABW352_20080 [Polyangiales bacterium]
MDDGDGEDDDGAPAGPDGGGSGRMDAAARDASPAVDANVARDAAPPVDAGGRRDATVETSFPGQGTPWMDTAPRATCAEGGKPDGTLGGLNGDFRCNLSVLGQVEAPHFLSLAWHQDCAFMNGPDGTAVIRVAADGKPTLTTTLSTVGFRSNWESMKANSVSGLLAGYESNGATLTVYDVAKDCSQPVFKSSTQLGALGSIGHAGSFSPDGTIYYASSMYTASIYAMDLKLPDKPVVITDQFARSAHDLYVGRDGTRGYFANPDVAAGLGIGSVAIMDLTDVQARKSGAMGKLISELTWQDGNISQYPIAVRYRGKDHLIISDELGSSSCADPKKPQWGYARIFDINDEKTFKLVSLIKTEAQDPANCTKAEQANGTLAGFGLGTHYCNVDRLDDPRVLACGNWDAGLRVYDIRNPWQPRELAYFDTPSANMPGLARILPDKGEIWIAVTPGTFYVLKIAAGSELATILAQD